MSIIRKPNGTHCAVHPYIGTVYTLYSCVNGFFESKQKKKKRVQTTIIIVYKTCNGIILYILQKGPSRKTEFNAIYWGLTLRIGKRRFGDTILLLLLLEFYGHRIFFFLIFFFERYSIRKNIHGQYTYIITYLSDNVISLRHNSHCNVSIKYNRTTRKHLFFLFFFFFLIFSNTHVLPHATNCVVYLPPTVGTRILRKHAYGKCVYYGGRETNFYWVTSRFLFSRKRATSPDPTKNTNEQY